MGSQFDVNNFNSFIQAASQQIACGTDCQQQQTAEQLKNTYLTAQSNLTLARPQYDIAKKNYYVYLLPVDYSKPDKFDIDKLLKINDLKKNIFEEKSTWSVINDGYIISKIN